MHISHNKGAQVYITTYKPYIMRIESPLAITDNASTSIGTSTPEAQAGGDRRVGDVVAM
jgi:hypothetical protein